MSEWPREDMGDFGVPARRSTVSGQVVQADLNIARDMRVSHAQRIRVMHHLEACQRDGYLDSSTAAHRIEAAEGAETARELGELTRDLPPTPGTTRSELAAGPRRVLHMLSVVAGLFVLVVVTTIVHQDSAVAIALSVLSGVVITISSAIWWGAWEDARGKREKQ